MRLFFDFHILGSVAKRSRGRPRLNPSKKDMKNCSIEEILKQPSHPLELVTTKVGGMKAAFRDFCYEFHYNRSGNKFWRCLSHTNGCAAKIMSKGSLMYPINVEHNHEIDPVVFVNTSELVSTKTISAPAKPEPEAIAATVKQPADKNSNDELIEKMKKRFAIIGKKLQKK